MPLRMEAQFLNTMFKNAAALAVACIEQLQNDKVEKEAKPCALYSCPQGTAPAPRHFAFPHVHCHTQVNEIRAEPGDRRSAARYVRL
jgi:hypothetical protein